MNNAPAWDQVFLDEVYQNKLYEEVLVSNNSRARTGSIKGSRALPRRKAKPKVSDEVRVCSETGCITVISTYNLEALCFLHTPLTPSRNLRRK